MVDQKISDLVAVTTAPDAYLLELANPGVSNVKITVANFIAQIIALGSGDVVGPASATDNAVVRYDGATGKLVQNSSVFIDDSGNLGVGTATPQGQLHIGTSVYTDPSVTGFSGAPITVSPNAVNIISEQGWLTSGGSLSYYIQAKHKVSTTKFNVVLNPYGGNVGIGTPAPSASLHVIGSNQPAMILERAGSTNATIQFQTLTGTVYFGQQASGTFCIGPNADLGNTPNFTVVQTTGFVGINQLSPTGMLEINTKLSTNKALIVKAAASQTANLQEWQNSAGTVLSGIAPDGDFVVENASANKPQFRLSGYETGMMLTGNDQINFVNNGITNVAIDNSGASRTFSLAVGVVFGWGSSATAAGIDSGLSRNTAGVIEINNGTSGAWAALRTGSPTATTVAQMIKAAASQTANLQEWQDSAGTVLATIAANGNLTLPDGTDAAPSFTFAGNSTRGFRSAGAGGQIIYSANSVSQCLFGPSNFTVRSDLTIGWTSGNAFGVAVDTGLSRNATGILEINNGTAGTFRDLKLRNINITQSATFNSEVDNGNSSTADTIDWTTGNKHKSTLTDNCTYTFTAPSGPTNLILKLTQDGTGSRIVTWPAACKWPGGTAPTLSTAANAVDIVSFYYDGSTYWGQVGLNFS